MKYMDSRDFLTNPPHLSALTPSGRVNNRAAPASRGCFGMLAATNNCQYGLG